MFEKLFLGLVWTIFVVYAFLFAPPNRAETLDLIIDLSTGNIRGINPSIVSLFNLMGVLPAVYACLLLVDGRGQKLPAWMFVAGSFATGAFALLPYLALRQKNTTWTGEKNLLIDILESPFTAIILTIVTLGLLFFGISQGDWSDFVQQWHSSRFINVMSIDFCLLCLLPPAIIRDDLAKRGIDNPAMFATISFVPLLGVLVYLCFRPKLKKVD